MSGRIVAAPRNLGNRDYFFFFGIVFIESLAEDRLGVFIESLGADAAVGVFIESFAVDWSGLPPGQPSAAADTAARNAAVAQSGMVDLMVASSITGSRLLNRVR